MRSTRPQADDAAWSGEMASGETLTLLSRWSSPVGGVMRAQHYLTGPAGTRRKQQVPGCADVVGVTVIAFAADAVIPVFWAWRHGCLKSSKDARMVGRPKPRSAAASSCPKQVLPAPVSPSTAIRSRPGLSPATLPATVPINADRCAEGGGGGGCRQLLE